MASTQSSRSRLRVFAEDYGLLVIAASFALLAITGVVLFFVGDAAFAKELIETYGLYVLFLIFVLEGAMLLYFAPSEGIVPFAIGALATTPSGYELDTIALIMVVAVVGATIGQTALFLLAKRGGREWLLQKPWFRVSDSKLERFEGWFDRWGRPAVLVSNALLFTRGMLTVPAGVAEMDLREFVVLSAAGTLIFESWLAVAAYYFFEFGVMELF
ncbi:membrane protein DedA, SNARE-associated domain [Halomicrobium zhouii]|uniref:Membrane protein DedA, SNARE-associated domain n=1 Tax=Halomicrobium zhouii TaxID=767519 RepID=A0A1I6KA00_9EURY|nr:VTT domain-containing protein [Halomicrobium zhouii]SFR88052.1 membrane protein DedA, SNARE-associated domain [Halomicrobium zhouii]